jgi:2-oxo-4-hydroxy-4-carboxy-5-ureidoimidazoline decarboxylase
MATSVQAELAAANARYAEQFGFIFIVCATGRSADAMLADLRARMPNTRAAEMRTAAEEQAKITRLRLGKLLAELGA